MNLHTGVILRRDSVVYVVIYTSSSWQIETVTLTAELTLSLIAMLTHQTGMALVRGMGIWF